MPFLYEHIRIAQSHGHRRLGSLLDVASRPPTIRTSSDSPPLGHFIKRLDLLIPALEWAQLSPDPSPAYSPAPQLCKLSPNLVTLITTAAGDCKGFPLSDVISPTLEYVHFLDYFAMHVSEWATFMDHHPRLAYMDSPMFIERSKFKLPIDWEVKSWPSVREIVLRPLCGCNEFPPGAFPNLQRLKTLSFSRLGLESVYSLVSIHGRSLTSLYLPRTFGRWHNFEEVQKMVNESCPKLKELMFEMRYPGGSWNPTKSDPLPSHVQIPGVLVLGVRSAKDNYANLFWEHFYDEALKLTTFFPNARTIRLFDEQNVVCLQNYPESLMSFLKDCKSRGICAKDHAEQPLSAHLASISIGFIPERVAP
ncbi:hypothetical protein H1R20_g11722, partial [Candolleomyces eurysporus]